MPDTYVPYRVLTFLRACHVAQCANQLNNVAHSCSPKLSARATSPARKMRCVSDQMNVAVVMDTLELAVTLVRIFFSYFFFIFTFSLCLLNVVFKRIIIVSLVNYQF